MRLIVSIAAALMFLSSFCVGQDDLFTPMKGSATPEFQTLDGAGAMPGLRKARRKADHRRRGRGNGSDV